MAEERDPLTYRIIGCAIAVHREFGPGLLESPYEEALECDMIANGLVVSRQPEVKVAFGGALLHRGFRPDFVVNGKVVVEIKSVDKLLPVHVAQVLTYMKFSGIELGLLINFNVIQLVKGVRRLILSNRPPQ
jgi:GxxExxY protein